MAMKKLPKTLLSLMSEVGVSDDLVAALQSRLKAKAKRVHLKRAVVTRIEEYIAEYGTAVITKKLREPARPRRRSVRRRRRSWRRRPDDSARAPASRQPVPGRACGREVQWTTTKGR